MKIVVLGCASMQGHKMFQMLGETFPETYGTISCKTSDEPLKRIPFFQTDKIIPEVNPMDFQCMDTLIRQLSPDWVINCLRVATHGNEVAPPILNITVNSLLPHRLVEMTARQGARLMHFSSDCVFSGKKGFYTEEDIPDATHAYGQTRLLGDVNADHALVLRSSVIGRELTGHHSLLDWFLMQKGKTIKGFTRAIYSGLSSIETARVVQMILEKAPSLTGLYHVASAPINKYDLLKLARDAFHANVDICQEEGFAVDRSLNAGKFNEATGYVAPSWEFMMNELAEDSAQYDAWGIRF
jgi:dTDP-4-dehydrorhamnose reductase